MAISQKIGRKINSATSFHRFPKSVSGYSLGNNNANNNNNNGGIAHSASNYSMSSGQSRDVNIEKGLYSWLENNYEYHIIIGYITPPDGSRSKNISQLEKYRFKMKETKKVFSLRPVEGLLLLHCDPIGKTKI